MVVFWYVLVPVVGAIFNYRSWRNFQQWFNKLRLKPFLDYTAYQTTEEGLFRFIGGFESTDGQTLWIRSTKLTVPVAIAGAQTYLFPMPKGETAPEDFYPDEEAPERIRWDRVSTLTEGARVFVGGLLRPLDNRMTFVSTKENPLLVIFYDGPERSLTNGIIRVGQYQNKYWNRLTPYGIILGAFSLIIMAFSFISRPAFRLTSIVAFIALFIPFYPFLPPGMIFTMLYRRLRRQAGIYHFCRDLARLPLSYFFPGEKITKLPDGESYGYVSCATLPTGEKAVPLLIPEELLRKRKNWYVFGAMSGEGPPQTETAGDPAEPVNFPGQPRDLFAPWGAIPGEPETLARGYTSRGRLLEIISWLMLLVGLVVNIFFIGMIVFVGMAIFFLR
ncbi:hypothetical protein LQZ21_10165 [Treponema sp. TIM-1]|uniref:hypothetical protein n=1 Tax=Treponema sp. TIM-1 TaxID=2898417 RepID=UPI00397ECF1A